MSNYSNVYNEHDEISQAIMAGERALESLQEADVALAGASTWGLFDIFGGNFLSGMLKHSRIKDARYHLENAKRDLLVFQDEYADVRGMNALDLGIGDFLTVADFLFDGLIADIFVQSKIEDARKSVRNAIDGVRDALWSLNERASRL